jgi:hypothetical protein
MKKGVSSEEKANVMPVTRRHRRPPPRPAAAGVGVDAALDDPLRAFLEQETEPDVAHFLTPPKPHHYDPDKE